MDTCVALALLPEMRSDSAVHSTDKKKHGQGFAILLQIKRKY